MLRQSRPSIYARGRIGLKLAHKHEDGKLVEPEELIERAKDAAARERSEEGPHGGAGRSRAFRK